MDEKTSVQRSRRREDNQRYSGEKGRLCCTSTRTEYSYVLRNEVETGLGKTSCRRKRRQVVWILFRR